MREHQRTHRRLLGKIAAAAGACALISGAAQAQNNFTDAGTNVANTFTLDYEVSGSTQPTITNDPTLGGGSVLQGGPTAFTVDRLIDLVVQEQTSPRSVAPGATGASTALDYLITNEGNDNQSYSFDIIDSGGGSDDFDATYTVEYYIDGDGDGNPFNDSPTTITVTSTVTGTTANITPDIAPDETFGVRITTSVPTGLDDEDVDDLVLVAQTRDPEDWIEEGPTTTEGDITVADTGGNTDTGVAENVLADGNGGTGQEGDNDGMHSDVGQYEVTSPELDALKTVDVIATNPSNCAADMAGGATEYSVPGSCVEYLISVTNNGATATATSIDISDTLPAEVLYVASFENSADPSGWEGTPAPVITETNCGVGDTPGACVVDLTGASLAPGNTGTLRVRATVR